MPIKVDCPSCSKHFTAPDGYAGSSAKCPNCGAGLQVPTQKPLTASMPADEDGDGPSKLVMATVASLGIVVGFLGGSALLHILTSSNVASLEASNEQAEKDIERITTSFNEANEKLLEARSTERELRELLEDVEVTESLDNIVPISDDVTPEQTAELTSRDNSRTLGISSREVIDNLRETYAVKVEQVTEGSLHASLGTDTVVIFLGRQSDVKSIQVWGTWTDTNTTDLSRTIAKIILQLGFDARWGDEWFVPALSKVATGFNISGSHNGFEVELMLIMWEKTPMVIFSIERP